MSLMDKYKTAWKYYLNGCEKHGIDCKIDFLQFIKSMTDEQVDMMLQNIK
ncbi:hypothetical protein ACJ2A9_07225 [Anaerobacillus sp. MEB173]